MAYRKIRNFNHWIKRGKSGKLLGSVKVTYSPRGIAQTPYVVTRTTVKDGIISIQYMKTRTDALNRAKEMMKRRKPTKRKK